MAHPGRFGAVSQIPVDSILYANGAPNTYFGWGGEDSDILTRLKIAYRHTQKLVTNLCPECKSDANPFRATEINRDISRHAYFDMPHTRHKEKGNEVNKEKEKLFMSRDFYKYYEADGLHTLKYELVRKEKLGAFTRIVVDLEEKRINFEEKIDVEKIHHMHPCFKSKLDLIECHQNMISKKDDEIFIY